MSLPTNSEREGPALRRSWKEVGRLREVVSDAEGSEVAVAKEREVVGDGRKNTREGDWSGGACRQRNLVAVPAIASFERG